MYVNHSPRGLEETLLTNRYEQLTRSLTLHLALGGNLQDNASARPQPPAPQSGTIYIHLSARCVCKSQTRSGIQ